MTVTPLLRIVAAALAVGAPACAGSPPAPPAFDAGRVIEHVVVQCGYGPRVPGSAARDSAAAYIGRTLASCGAHVSRQEFELPDPYADTTLHLVNVIGRFEPNRRKRVVLAAHYDSRPRADQDVDSLRNTPIDGAVDGAAGVGVLLEIARLLGTSMPRGIGVDLVFFDGEDYGKEGDLANYLLGSKHYVAGLGDDRPRCMVLVDMVGGVETRVAREGYSHANSPALVDELFRRASAMQLDYFYDVVGPPVYDDHVPFIEAGIEAVDLFGYNYRHWHTVRDTPDKVEAGLVEQVGRLLVHFLFDFPR